MTAARLVMRGNVGSAAGWRVGFLPGDLPSCGTRRPQVSAIVEGGPIGDIPAIQSVTADGSFFGGGLVICPETPNRYGRLPTSHPESKI